MAPFTARAATADEVARWDELVPANPLGGNVLQSGPFSRVKVRQGWQPIHLAVESPDYTSYVIAYQRSIPVLGALWYLIKGPDTARPEDVPPFVDAVVAHARRRPGRVFAVKIEPDFPDTEELRALFAGAGLVKTFNIQANDSTAILDLTPDENQLLRNLSSRGRNAVRRAIRDGVRAQPVEAGEDTYRTMYALMGQAQQGRLSAVPRPYEYYRGFWQEFVDAGMGRFYFVYEDGKPSVGAFVILYGRKATYKDGGSLPKRNQYGDSHLVQWEAILDMKRLGAREYDFCGTPPADRLKDKDHPQYGLGMFKTSFTKTVTDFAGCYDAVVRPRTYRVWHAVGERVARQIHWRRHRQPFY